jgi:hypothetical protein
VGGPIPRPEQGAAGPQGSSGGESEEGWPSPRPIGTTNQRGAVGLPSRPPDRTAHGERRRTSHRHDPWVSGPVVVRGRRPPPSPGKWCTQGEQARPVKTVKVQWHPAGGAGSDRRFPLGVIRVACRSHSVGLAGGLGVWRTQVGDRYRLGHRPVVPHIGLASGAVCVGWLNVQSGPRKPLEDQSAQGRARPRDKGNP